MSRVLSRFAIIAAVSCLAGTADAGTVGLSVASGGTYAMTGEYVLGYSFLVNSPISVVSLGVYDESSDGLVNSHDVGLWNSSGTLLASVTVPSGTAGTLNSSFRFAPVTPVDLTAGLIYYVGATTQGVSDWWLRDPGTMTTAPEITYDSRRYGLYSGSLVFPDLTGSGTTGYFGGNFEFEPSAVPEPSTFALMIVGGLAFVALRRRRSA
jgi:Domain of unknown function (DUF4082)/PEP-CTERM motif